MKKRLLCSLIVLTMLLPMFPVRISAAEPGSGGQTISGDYVAVVNTGLDQKSTGTLTFDDGVVSRDSADAEPLEDAAGDTLMLPGDDVILPGKDTVKPKAKKGFFGITPKASYTVGQEKHIGKMDYICIGISDKSYIWMEKGLKAQYDQVSKTNIAAADMASVYEGRPYDTLMALSGGESKFPYEDNSGKLSILIENSASTGFYSGEPGITAIHVKAEPASSYRNGDYAKYNGLLAHEGQHALFRWLVCGGDAWLASEMLWLNEGLAVAAMDYVWGGSDPTGWLTRIEGSAEIRGGASLVYGSAYRGSTALDYSMPYLFVRYLADQKAKGYDPLSFYQTFYTQKAEKGKLTEYFSKVMSGQTGMPRDFGTALEQFYTAAAAQEGTGAYGFYNDQTVRKNLGDYPVYMGESGKKVSLEGTAAIIIKTKARSFTVPQDGDSAIKYIAFNKEGAKLPEGAGTAADPYRIKTAADLSGLAYKSGSFFKLENNIDVTGKISFTVPSFTGTLDGNGHTITGLSKVLFSENRGTVTNLRIENFTGVEASWSGIISNFNYGAITDCSVTGNVTMSLTSTNPGALPYFGTMTGENQLAGTIERCFSDADITVKLPDNTGAVGALAGNNSGKIRDSYAQGSVTVKQTGTRGNISVGGIAGKQFSSYSPFPSMRNCYSVADIKVTAEAGVKNTGRLVGLAADNGTLNNCYALDGMPAAQGNSAGAESKTDGEMKTQATYKDWQFGGIWQMPAGGGYPEFYRLKSGDIQVEMPNDSYYVGEKLNLFQAFVVIGKTKIEMTPGMLEPFDSSTAGEKSVKGSYKGETFSFHVRVAEPKNVSALMINTKAKADYTEGQLFDKTGAVLMATIDGSPYRYIYSGFTVDKTEALKTADKEVTYTYGDAAVSQIINVNAKSVKGISVIQTPEIPSGGYYVGDALKLNGLRVQLEYNDGTKSGVVDLNGLEGADIHISQGLSTKLEPDKLPVLNENDNGSSLYVYYGDKTPDQGGAVYKAIMKLEVKKGLWLDNQIVEMSVDVDSFGIKTEAVEGGSGSYTVTKKSGKLPEGTDMAVNVPGYMGSTENKFVFYGKPSKLGEEQELIYTITDKVPGGRSIDVKITVKVVQKSSYKELLKFNFEKANNAGRLSRDVAGVVGDDSVSVVVPNNTDVTNLTPSLDYDQYRTQPAPAYVNGKSHDFTNPVRFEMLAEDGSVGYYTVTVTKATAEAAALTVPVNLKWDNGKALWDKTEDAQGYAIELYRNDKGDLNDRIILDKYSTTENSFDFSDILSKKDNYSFKVIAVGNGSTTLNSARSGFSPIIELKAPYVYNVEFLTPPASLKKGSEQKLHVDIKGVGSFNKEVVWSVSNNESADTKILADGTLSVGLDETARMITVKAASVSNADRYAEADIRVDDIPKLPAPQDVKWSNDSVASWSPVNGAEGYQVTLFKNDTAESQPITTPDTGYSFRDAIQASGTGDYTFRVQALGDGKDTLASDLVGSAVYKYTESPTVTEVKVTPESTSVQKGTKLQFTANVTGTNNPSQEVAWTVEGNNSDKTSISKQGELSVSIDETASKINVIAVSKVDINFKGKAAVTVTDIPKLAAPSSLKWENKSAKWDAVTNATGYNVELYKGSTKVSDTITTTETTFSFSEKIIENGTGSYTFKVMAKGDGTNALNSDIVESTAYSYTVEPTVTGVTINPSAVTLKKGSSYQFTAEVIGANGPSQAVIWTISGTNNANTAITEAGQLTIGSDEAAGEIKVIAASAVDTTKSGEAIVTITDIPKLETPQNLKWNLYTAAWDAVANSAGYSVELYKDGEKKDAVETDAAATSHEFTGKIVESGTYVFRVVAKGDGTNHASSDQAISPEFEYKQAPEVTAVQISPKKATVAQGMSQAFTAEVTGVGDFDKTTSFSISGQTSSRTLIKEGILTLGDDETAKTIIVKLTSAADNTKTDTAEVTVRVLTNTEKAQNAIDALPNSGDITEANLPQIKKDTAAAKAQFDKLSAAEKEMLTQQSQEKLEDVIIALGNISIETKSTGVIMTASGLGLLAAADEIAGSVSVKFEFIAERRDTTPDGALIRELAENKNFKLGELYTVNIIKTTEGQAPVGLTLLSNPVKMTVEIPESLKGKEVYEVVRVHEGKAEALVTKSEKGRLYVESDKYSTYGLIYKENETTPPPTPDPPVNPTPDPPVNPTPDPPVNPTPDPPVSPDPVPPAEDGSAPNNSAGSPAATPGTGDETKIMENIVLFVLAGAVLVLAGAAYVVKRVKRYK